jgi:hypothetical protein
MKLVGDKKLFMLIFSKLIFFVLLSDFLRKVNVNY